MSASFWLTKKGLIASKPQSLLSGKTPAEAIVMSETRRLLQLLINDPTAKVSADLRIAAKGALRHRSRRTAPFLPLSPEHRLGWLDEFSHLECQVDLPGAFSTENAYRHNCHDVPTRRIIERNTMSGDTEEVLVSGVEMLVTIHDDLRRLHAFANFEVPEDPRIHAIHDLQTLLIHFKIPKAPDITKILPATHKKLISTLQAI
jgi:hypothetical protein